MVLQASRNAASVVPSNGTTPLMRPIPTATIIGLAPWALALIDQALVSGSRFATTLVVGRFCGPAELGEYSLAFSLHVLAGCVQEALLTTPYAVVSKRLRPRSRATYAGAIARMYFSVA